MSKESTASLKNEHLKYKSIKRITLISQLTIAVNDYNSRRIHNGLPFKQFPIQIEEKLPNSPSHF
jgi:hypothetical protein